MARALIVGCGCRGRALGAALLDEGWVVRGTTRDPQKAGAIEAAGIEPAVADPDRAGTVLELISDVTLIYWLLGSASGRAETVGVLHAERLERVLEEIVDTPVRGFVYEASGTVAPEHLADGAEAVRAAGARWRMPVAVAAADPEDLAAWRELMLSHARDLAGAA